MTKFVSKNANYHVILRNGLSGDPMRGLSMTPGKSVKFTGGIAILDDEETIELLKKHPMFNVHFLMIEEGKSDPYEGARNVNEPNRMIQTMEHGAVGEVKTSRPTIDPTTAIKEAAVVAAKAMLKEALPDILATAKKEWLAEIQAGEAQKTKAPTEDKGADVQTTVSSAEAPKTAKATK